MDCRKKMITAPKTNSHPETGRPPIGELQANLLNPTSLHFPNYSDFQSIFNAVLLKDSILLDN